MAAGSTYTPIATTTVSGTPSSVTLSSIPSSYTDLVLIIAGASSTGTSYKLQFNGDTGTNYSSTYLYGDGSAAASGRVSNNATMNGFGRTDGSGGNGIINIQNYANTSIYKTAIGRGSAAGNLVIASVGLWRSTAAINSITIQTEAGTFSTGETLTLYGIAAA